MGLMNWPIRQRMGGCGPPPPQWANCGSSRTCGSPGCGSPPQLVKILKELELVASVNGPAVREFNLQLGLYKSYASGLRSKYF
jgi:hypothetical protein